MELKKNGLYFVDFDYTLNNGSRTYFSGICKYSNSYNDDDLHLSDIIKTFFTSNDTWKPGFSFYITKDDFKKEIIPEEYPEYFI